MIHLHCFEGVSWCDIPVFEVRVTWNKNKVTKDFKPLKRYVHCTVEGLAVATCGKCVAEYTAQRLRLVSPEDAA